VTRPTHPSTHVRCPSCGGEGRSVKPVTLESLVADETRVRVGGTDGFRFCAEPGCDVAYFHAQSGQTIVREEVRVPIGQKETSPGRTVCYCFGYTAAEVKEQVAATGTSVIPDEIGAKCKQGLDRCDETNPQGTCCLGNVRRVLRDAQARIDAGPPSSVSSERKAPDAAADCCAGGGSHSPVATRNVGLWATGGAVVSAVLSSACCWLPLLLIGFGASAAGVSGFFEAYRPYLLAATAVLLATGFYLVYLRRGRCEVDGACAVPNPKLIRFNKAMLWIASAVVLAFALFPSYVGALLGGESPSGPATASSGAVREFRIEGMTCVACAETLRSKLTGLSGVAHVDVSYETKTAKVQVEQSVASPTDDEIASVISAAGYRGIPVTPEAGTIRFHIAGMTCAGCASALQGRLVSVPGVEEAKVDYETETATVLLGLGGSADQVLAVIRAQGFDGRVEVRPQ